MKFIHASILIFILQIIIIPFLNAQDTLLTKYPNSTLRWEKVYQEEEKIAENIYHENGEAWMTVQYQNEANQVWKWYYDNGNPYFEAIIVDDLLQGSYKIWYENGQLAEQLFFKDNVENGLAVFYHSNGQLAMKGIFEKGQMIGDWEFFTAEGETPDGVWEWYFAAALDQIRVKGQFKNGQPYGKWVYWGTANQGRKSQLVFEKEF
ncbi:MAG: hypothetical protein AAFP82_06605 [Bacteroidota bacterium]